MDYYKKGSQYDTIIRIFRIYSKRKSISIEYKEIGYFNKKYPRVDICVDTEIKEEPPYDPEDILYHCFDYYPDMKAELKKEFELAVRDPDFSWSKRALQYDFYMSHSKMTDQEVLYAFLSKTWMYVCPEKKAIYEAHESKLRQFFENDLSFEEWETIDCIVEKIKKKYVELVEADRVLLLCYLHKCGRVSFWGKNTKSIFHFQHGWRIRGRKTIEMKHVIGTNTYLLRYPEDIKKYIVGTI
jgi:hypothetical protein